MTQLPLPAPPVESVQIVIREPGGRVMHLQVAPVLIPLLIKAGWKIVEEEK